MAWETTMSIRSAIAALILPASLLASAALAQDPGGAQLAEGDTKAYDFQPLNSGEGATRGITRGERDTVQNYINGGRGSIAAWQSSLDRLPPGTEDELQPGAPLPPGVKIHGLPNSLESALPQRRAESWAVSGYSLLLVDRESGVIIDVWRKVFEPY